MVSEQFLRKSPSSMTDIGLQEDIQVCKFQIAFESSRTDRPSADLEPIKAYLAALIKECGVRGISTRCHNRVR